MFLQLAGNERHFRCLSTKTKIACALVRGCYYFLDSTLQEEEKAHTAKIGGGPLDKLPSFLSSSSTESLHPAAHFQAKQGSIPTTKIC